MRVRKPSPAMVVALIALIAALGGTAWALQRGAVKSKHLAKNAVTDRSLKEIDGIKLKRLAPSATNASESAAQAAATPVTIGKHGNIKLYAKCWKSTMNPANPGVHGGVFLAPAPGALFQSGGAGTNNDPLQAGANEDQRTIYELSSFAGVGDPGTLNVPDADDQLFYVAAGKRYLEGRIFVATKVGSPEGGNGPFGSGDGCLVGGNLFKR